MNRRNLLLSTAVLVVAPFSGSYTRVIAAPVNAKSYPDNPQLVIHDARWHDWLIEFRQANPVDHASRMVYRGWYAYHPDHGEYGDAIGSTDGSWEPVLSHLTNWLKPGPPAFACKLT